MSTTSMLLPFPLLVIIITTAVVFLSTPRFTYAENQNEEEENLDFIQRFVHPYVTEGSKLDSAPFAPPQHTPAGFPGVRVLCKCGIQNGKSAHFTITKNEEELELDLNETIWSNSSSKADSNKNKRSQNVTIPDSFPFPIIPAHVLISKGIETEINEYPWIVALIYNLSNGTQVHFCGGTLFSNKYILTATHCLAGKRADKTEVWLNEHDILLSTETPGGTLQIKAQKFIIHPKYNSIMHYNDISIIELEEEVDIKQSYYRPLCLPSPNFDPITSESGVEGVAAGWGQTFFHGPKSAKLLKVSLPILSHDGCITKSEPFYKKRVTDHMICAGDIATGGRDTCPGDSGGPLFVSYRGKNVLVGIVSWGYRCGEPKKPGVYTRVSKYINWINQETSHGQRCAG